MDPKKLSNQYSYLGKPATTLLTSDHLPPYLYGIHRLLHSQSSGQQIAFPRKDVQLDFTCMGESSNFPKSLSFEISILKLAVYPLNIHNSKIKW